MDLDFLQNNTIINEEDSCPYLPNDCLFKCFLKTTN